MGSGLKLTPPGEHPHPMPPGSPPAPIGRTSDEAFFAHLAAMSPQERDEFESRYPTNKPRGNLSETIARQQEHH